MSVTTAIQSATRKIGTMISRAPSEPEILDTLKQEHEEVAELLKKLVDGKSSATRKGLLAKIKAALLPHIQAEQTVLYDSLIAIGDKKIQQDGQEGYLEHELAAAMLAKLETIANALSPEFGAGAKVLKELIEHHVEEEERNIWADAKEKFCSEQRVTMNHKYLAAKTRSAGDEKAASAKTAAFKKAEAPTVRKRTAVAPKAAVTSKPGARAKRSRSTAPATH